MMLWWPYDYLDEVMPEGRDSPSAWVVETPEGLRLAHPDDPDSNQTGPALQDGQVVRFSICEDLAEGTVTLAADGTWSCDTAMPARANTCCIMDGWQVDTIGNSVDETCQQIVEADAGDYCIAFYRWAGGDFRLNAATRKFEPAGPVQ